MGFTPKLEAHSLGIDIIAAIEKKYNIDLPKDEGMDTLACIQAAEKGDIDFALLLGGKSIHCIANP